MRTIIVSLLMFLLIPMSSIADDEHQGYEIQFLKKWILQIAYINQDNDARLRIRNRLDPLVNRLLELTPSLTEEQRSALVVGSWKSIWSDQAFGFGVDVSQVYQVVNPDGYYYNISKVETEQGVFTNFLRGAYEDKGSYLAIVFTDNEIVPDFFEEGTDLVELAENFEKGDISNSQSIPGPIGITGVLMNIYVDDSLRIVYGNSLSDSRPRLFILERFEEIIYGDFDE